MRYKINMQQLNKVILVIGICLVLFALVSKNSGITPNIITPDRVVPSVPELIQTMFYDEYEKAMNVANTYDKKLILIFGVDWCPYCKQLKENAKDIEELKYYIVCFIDTDLNKGLVADYKIKGIPTSVILYKKEEEARKSGYRKLEYRRWLEDNKNHGEKAWSNLSY